MATISITIPDANVTRVRAAFGHEEDGIWVAATNPEVQTAITRWVRQRVRDYEERLASDAARAAVQDAL